MIKLHMLWEEGIEDTKVRINPDSIADYYQIETGHPDCPLGTYIHVDNRENLAVRETPTQIDEMLEAANQERDVILSEEVAK